MQWGPIDWAVHPSEANSTQSTVQVVAAIPARYASKRLPGKPLLEIAGVTLIERVYRQVERARGISEVIVLTDDSRIADAVLGFGGRVMMTPEDLASGSDRVAYAARDWGAKVILNVQGDEPLIAPEALSRLAKHLVENPDDDVATLAAPATPEDFDNPDVVKVVSDTNGRALYFSRAGIPYARASRGGQLTRPQRGYRSQRGYQSQRHIGVYGYQRKALLEIAATPQTPLELAESLEQLRMLESGFSIRVLSVAKAWPGVDTITDSRRVEAYLAEHGDPLAGRRAIPTSRADS